MMNLSEISDPDVLIDAIAALVDERAALDDEIKTQTVRAVHHLGARRNSAAAAAAISRPTLNKWLDEYAETAGAEWNIVGV